MDEEAVPSAPPQASAQPAPIVEASPASPRDPIGPVTEPERIAGLDVVRGFALLGILLVNIQLFAEPFGTFLEQKPGPGESARDAIVFYLVKIFCEGKFYPIFSLLFGMGLVLQTERARRRQGRAAAMYLRRLGLLAMIGLLHGLLLWYGDILFTYSVCGAIVLAASRLPARVLFILAVIALAGITLLTFAGAGAAVLFFGEALSEEVLTDDANAPAEAPSEPQASDTTGQPEAGADDDAESDEAATTDTTSAAEAESTATTEGLLETLREAGFSPFHPAWMAAETEAFRDGPFLRATAFRAINFGFSLLAAMFGYGWEVIGMFLLGAALAKWGFFAPARRGWRVGTAVIGLALGLPLAVLATILPQQESAIAFVLGAVCTPIASPVLGVAYLAAVMVIVESRWLPRIAAAVAKVGRMGLTNYLFQTVVATAIFYHWGLGLFGETTRTQRFLIALGIYAAQLIISALWMRAFRYGPMEWLWRSVTYLKPQPMRRGKRLAHD